MQVRRKPRDFAIDALVTALNADAGAGTWAFVPSPAAADLPPLAEQDVIRNGFIYKPGHRRARRRSEVLADSHGPRRSPTPASRWPRRSRPVGGADADAFAVIVNHFKSKGSRHAATPTVRATPTTGPRSLQANGAGDLRQRTSRRCVASRASSSPVTSTPTRRRTRSRSSTTAGYTNLESTDRPRGGELQLRRPDRLARPRARQRRGRSPMSRRRHLADQRLRVGLLRVQPLQLQRHQPVRRRRPVQRPPTTTRRSSASTSRRRRRPRTIQILGTNDFHGRIANDPSSAAAGAAVMAGAVKQLRAANPDTVFAAAGDLIGASTFESFIQNDKPTIDALNEAGLEVSAAGNHEFDQGADDLVNRVMAPYDASTNPFGGAEWEYIAANVRNDADDSRCCRRRGPRTSAASRSASWVRSLSTCPSWSSRRGSRTSTSPTSSTRSTTAADDLKADGADMVVMLVHEGAPGTDCAAIGALGPDTDFGAIVQGVNDNIDAIVSGHTHLAYNCSFPVPGLGDRGRAVTERPVVSAGQYGTALNQIVFTVDTATGEVLAQDPGGAAAEGARNGGPVQLPGRTADRGDRGRRGGGGRGARCGAAGSDRWSDQAGLPGRRDHGEPWRGVGAGQPGRRGAAVADLGCECGCGADRVHEPGWSARGHARQRARRSRRR